MDIIEYNPHEQSLPVLINSFLEKDILSKYTCFIFSDIKKAAKNLELTLSKYEKMMEILQIPYAFFPYYIHFNKVLPSTLKIPNPRISYTIIKSNLIVDAVDSVSYGMLILNLEKFKEVNYKFREDLPHLFYLQDMIDKSNELKIYPSNSLMIDIHKSYEEFNLDFNDFENRYRISPKDFKAERELFFKDNNVKHESLMEFDTNFKNYLKDLNLITITEENKES